MIEGCRIESLDESPYLCECPRKRLLWLLGTEDFLSSFNVDLPFGVRVIAHSTRHKANAELVELLCPTLCTIGTHTLMAVELEVEEDA